MATLSVYGAEFSLVKRRAIEDGKKMQAIVDEECELSGKDLPPYRLQELIGKGSFGRVYKATNTKSNQLVAVKIIDIEGSDSADPRRVDTWSEILKEIAALRRLSEGHAKNINHVLEALPFGQSMWVITEYCAGGSVATLMRPTAPGGLQEKWIIPIVREVAEAITWVHEAGIIHRDIKCANVLVTETGSVQLCDFGVAGVIETKFDKRATVVGTVHWMPPELLEGTAPYGTEVDIWAFGSMIYELASGLPPNAVSGVPIDQLGSYIKKNAPRLEGNKYSHQLKDLVAFCLDDNPISRPTIQHVKRHPYIAGTVNSHPTASLALLVRAFKLWETQGGSRRSLFAPGGAQAPSSDLISTAMVEDEWNFHTTIEIDRQTLEGPDSQTVFNVYGTQVDFDAEEEATPRPPKPRSRRRPPRNMPVMKGPLENIFSTNTDLTYVENSRAYYGLGPPPPPPEFHPPPSDLPLRDNNSAQAAVRESLIDLDACLDGSSGISPFADMDTIRAPPRLSVEEEYSDWERPPFSDPPQPADNRRTQEWTFPSMAGPATAHPEMANFSFHGNRPAKTPGSGSRPPLTHHPTEPIGLPSLGYDPGAPKAQDNRMSTSSLIDLDESMPDPLPELTRPSTANSDAGSVATSEIGGANPFELERHASLYQPQNFGAREPSIYISDDSDFARLAKAPEGLNEIREETIENFPPPRDSSNYHEENGMYSGDEQSDQEYLTMQPRYPASSQASDQFSQTYSDDTNSAPSELPSLPQPPALRVMQGTASRQEVRDELQRMLASFHEHLSYANEHVQSLPVRSARSEQQIDE